MPRYTYNGAGRLTDDEFVARFGKLRAASIQGPFILSAILADRSHAFYNWQTGTYVVERTA